MFMGGRASDAGNAALAAAVMDGFRLAPAGLSDDKLVPLMRALPDEIRIEMEKTLKADGFYKGKPDRQFRSRRAQSPGRLGRGQGPINDDTGVANAQPDESQRSHRRRAFGRAG